MRTFYQPGLSTHNFRLLTLAFALFVSGVMSAQTFVQRNVSGTANTSSQISATAAKRVQSIYTPSDLGNPTASGNIDTVYIMRNSTGALTLTDLEVYLGQTTDTILTTDFNANAASANMQLVYGPGAYAIPGSGTAGEWLAIPLNSFYFNYDPTKSLVVETRFTNNASSSVWAARVGTNDPANTNKRIIANSPTATVGTYNVSRINFAFFVQPSNADDAAVLSVVGLPSTVTPGSYDVNVNIQTFGTDTLKNALIGWEVNGNSQAPFAWTGSLAQGETASNVTIGSFNFTDYVTSIKAWIYSPNGNVDGFNDNDTATLVINVCNPLVGNYTIDKTQVASSTNFTSINEFADRMSTCGISGHVNVEIVAGSGPYFERVEFKDIAGSDDTARIYFNGNGETITSDGPILTAFSDRHVFRLTDVKYFTLDNLKVELVTGSTAFLGIHVFNTGSYINIKNCTVDMKGTTSTLIGGIILSGSPTAILTAGNYDSVLIENNTTIAGGYGASAFGLTNPLITRLVIANNTFLDFNDNGVYLRETNGAVVIGNTLNKRVGTNNTSNGIQIAQTANANARIIGNYISMEQNNGSFRGIYFFGGTGHKAYNNVFYNFHNTVGEISAFRVRGGAPEMYFNTISFNSDSVSTGKLSAVFEELSNTNFVFKNNIVSITQPCDSIRAFVVPNLTNLASSFVTDYNVYHIPNGKIGQRVGTFYDNLLAWQGVTFGDGSSFEANPAFVNDSLPLIPTNDVLNDLAEAIAGIDVDVLGNPRSSTPDFGAYEFTPCVDPAQPDTITGGVLVCRGTTVTYAVDSVAGETYTWSVSADATILSGQGTATISVEFGNAGSEISVFATDACGSSNFTKLAVTVRDSLLAPGAITGDTAFCSVASGVTYSIGSVDGADNYLWTVVGSGSISSGQGDTAVVVDFSAAGTVTLRVTASNICETTAASELEIEVNTPPAVGFQLPQSTFCSTVATVALSGETPAGGTFSGTAVSGSNFSPQTAGTGKFEITYTYTDNGCTASATDSIEVETCLSIGEAAALQSVVVSPNPFSIATTITFSRMPESSVMASLINVDGKVILTMTVTTNTFTIERNNLPAGIYFLNLKTDSGTIINKRVMIQ